MFYLKVIRFSSLSSEEMEIVSYYCFTVNIGRISVGFQRLVFQYNLENDHLGLNFF